MSTTPSSQRARTGVVGEGRHQNELRLRSTIAKVFEHGEPVHDREPEIGDDEVVGCPLNRPDPHDPSVSDLVDAEVIEPERLDDEGAHLVVVLGDERIERAFRVGPHCTPAQVQWSCQTSSRGPSGSGCLPSPLREPPKRAEVSVVSAPRRAESKREAVSFRLTRCPLGPPRASAPLLWNDDSCVSSSVDPFEQRRPRLRSLAYRMLGSWSDAEDVVQDCYLRWQAARETVDSPDAWLARVVTNLCLDLQKSSRVRRETYVGEWLPEPVATEAGRLGGDAVDPEDISLALLTLLERLSPLERAVYVLSQAFDFGPQEIAGVLGKTEPAVRQLLHRAREHVTAGRPRFRATDEAHVRMLGAFVAACTTGDLQELKALLADDVVAVSDGGGNARAALNPISGAHDVARFFLGIVKKGPSGLGGEVREVNGGPAFVARLEGRPFAVVHLVIDGDRIKEVLVVVNPEKLRHVG